MKTAPFAYLPAASRDEAVAALADDTGRSARILAGGQSLVPMMALRLSVPEVLIDISRTADLATFGLDDQRITIGAAVTDRTLERDPAVRERFPLLTEVLGYIGHVEIRNRGTVCGSIAHADPAAELPALMLALEGTATLASTRGLRSVPAAELVVGPYATCLDEDEMLGHVELALPSASSGCAIEEAARRHGDFAIAGVIAILDTDPDGRCTDARIAAFGVAATAVRARAAEQVLVGERLGAEVIDESARHLLDDVEVLGDIHGSETYRRATATVLAARGLRRAAAGCAAIDAQARR